MIKLIVPEVKFKDIAKELKRTIDSGILTKGPNVEKFEKTVASFVGTKYAFATTSATTALHLSLVALDIGPGDEVLVPDFTFPATANVVVQTGAKPILVDIDLTTYNINLKHLEQQITKKTKAIIPVDIFGCPVDIKGILKIAKKYKLAIIEDAACALGAEYCGKKCGSLGTIGCFSFHPRKSITTGEGGMIVTNNRILAEKIKILKNHGGQLNKSGYYFTFKKAGFNYRMTEMQAIMGIMQMKKINQIITQRRKIAHIYSKKLVKFNCFKIPQDSLYGKHSFQSYVILLDKKINRDSVIKKMRNKGIEVTIGTYALHTQPFYIKNYGYKPGNLKNSFEASKRTLTLPLYSRLTAKQIDYIISNLINIIENL